MSKHPLARDVARKAAERGIADPAATAGIALLLAIAGSIFGPTINRAMRRYPDDRRLYDSVAEMLEAWVATQTATVAGD